VCFWSTPWPCTKIQINSEANKNVFKLILNQFRFVPERMVFCTNCGQKIQGDSAKFCVSCGTPVVAGKNSAPPHVDAQGPPKAPPGTFMVTEFDVYAYFLPFGYPWNTCVWIITVRIFLQERQWSHLEFLLKNRVFLFLNVTLAFWPQVQLPQNVVSGQTMQVPVPAGYPQVVSTWDNFCNIWSI
jgi:hypothetical protein